MRNPHHGCSALGTEGSACRQPSLALTPISLGDPGGLPCCPKVIYTLKPSKTQTRLSQWLTTQQLHHPSMGEVQRALKASETSIHCLRHATHEEPTYTTALRVGITAKVVHIPNVHFHSCATHFVRTLLRQLAPTPHHCPLLSHTFPLSPLWFLHIQA